MPTASSRRHALFAAAVLFASLAAQAIAAPGTPWWTEPSAPQTHALTPILGSGPATWRVTDRYAHPMTGTVAVAEGIPVLVSTSDYVVLNCLTAFPTNTEIVLRCRLVPPGKATASVQVQAALTNLLDAREAGLLFTLSGVGTADAISWHAGDPVPAEPIRPYVAGTYYLKGLGGRRLNWPDDLRRLIERDLAVLPDLSDKWITVRYVLRREAIRIYLNDRLLLDRSAPGMNTTGFLRIQLSPYVQLASVRAVPFPGDIGPFEPIPIRDSLNADRIDGERIAPASLPPPSTPCLVEGVPFVFPGPDPQGRDHIDVGASWFQSGTLEGDLEPQSGPIAGRWMDALHENPSRLRFRVPRGRYRALHLLAAADGEPDSVPFVTIQFYRPNAGHPVNVRAPAPVPALRTRVSAGTALPVTLAGGRPARLSHVVIPINPGDLAAFADLDALEMELTKEVKLFRGYPDPTQYSVHAAGLPSSVHLYAMTLERPAFDLTFQPEAYAHIWTAPATPAYTVTLRSQDRKAHTVELELVTASYDGATGTVRKTTASVPADGRIVTTRLSVSPGAYGFHAVTLTAREGEQVWTENASLAYLHADTRERGDWDYGRGPVFGFWNWHGGHVTPPADRQTWVMAVAGAESHAGSFATADEAEQAIARQFRMATFKYFSAGDHYVTAQFRYNLATMPPAQAEAIMIEGLRKTLSPSSPISRPMYLSFFPEPHLGPITSGCLPDYWGEPPYVLSPSEEEAYQSYERAFVLGARAVKKTWPDVKCLLPHGDPLFCAYFLRRSPEVRQLIDGVTVDIPCFERLPEQQLHQVSLHRMYMCREEFRRAGITNPVLPMYEGPCLSSKPGGLSQRDMADLSVRNSLILLAYGVNPQVGGWCPFDCAGYWGEQHYGGGIIERQPLLTPKPAYAAFATMTRHLNRRNFTGWLPLGSLSSYALQFQHYRTGERLLVAWTIRGKRSVRLDVPPGSALTVYDTMDNATVLREKEGAVTFWIDQSPRYVEGLASTAEVKIALGEPDHSDAAPAAGAVRLGNPGDGSWTLSRAEDTDYTTAYFYQIRRYPGDMTLAPTSAPASQGGRALAVHLGAQKQERKVMPFYTTLVPHRPLEIPGKASHLGLWVHAASDWGRVVYSLRDAKGERWLSVGTKDSWNCDDTHNWSVFCFEGWRYLRFELPANSPYDRYREAGSVWWGHYGPGDGIVDLPLSLEKILVERRTHALYVNDPQPTRPDDVLLADLYTEYESAGDRTGEALRLARLRMPVPTGVARMENPIRDFAVSGVGAPARITKIALPDQNADGTRCFVHFEPVAGVTNYSVWASPYDDGTGALALGKAWKQSGQQIQGLRPNTDFFLFVVYTDKDGKPSKPSAPFRIRLQDIFGMK